MPIVKLYNLAKMTTATVGTGTLTLGSAVSGFLSFASAGVQNGDTVTYAIADGANSEIGRGVYTAAGTTLTRTVLKSTNSDAAISLSGAAQVFITAAAEDFAGRSLWNPPLSTDFSVEHVSGTGLKESITDDPSAGLAMIGKHSASALNWSRSKAIVNTSAWEFIARLDLQMGNINYCAAGVVVFANGQTNEVHWRVGQGSVETVSRLTQAGNAFTANDFIGVGMVPAGSRFWLKITYDGTLLKYYISNSPVFGAKFAYSANAVTQLGAAPTHLGFGMICGTTANTEHNIYLACDYFSTTAW